MSPIENSQPHKQKNGLFASKKARLAWTYRTMRDFLECRRLHGERDPSEPPTWDDYEEDEEAQRGLAKSHRIRRMPGSGSIVDPLNADRLDLEAEREVWLETVRPHVLRLLKRWKSPQTRQEALEEINAATDGSSSSGLPSQREFLKIQILKAFRFVGVQYEETTLRGAELGEFAESFHQELTREVVDDLTSHLARPDLRKDLLVEDYMDETKDDQSLDEFLGALVGGETPLVQGPRHELQELHEAAVAQGLTEAEKVLEVLLNPDCDDDSDIDDSNHDLLKKKDSSGPRTEWSLNHSAIGDKAGLTPYKVRKGLKQVRTKL